MARPSGWVAEGPVSRTTNRLTARLSSAATSSVTGSLSAGAPGGRVTEGRPPKVSTRSVEASMLPGAEPGRPR